MLYLFLDLLIFQQLYIIINVMKIYFIRHCSTNANKKNIWQGTSDIEPSIEGLEELKALKKEVKNIKFDIVFSSPLKRALITANTILDSNSKLVVTSEIIERNFGELELKEVQPGQKELLSNLKLNTDLGMGVEKINDMYINRVKPFLLKLKNEYKNSDKKIAIVSHSWVGRLASFFSTNDQDESKIQTAPKNAKIYEYEI